MNSYLQGSLVTVATYSGPVSSPAGGFRDRDGVLADPGTVILRYRPGPGHAVVTVAYPDARIVRDGTGLYHADLDTTGSVGQQAWTYEWSGTGAVQAPAASSFTVYPPLL